ncbi:MAG: cache domain-containing protein, partial [Gammaproteobacteria bacterium]|nr:cache domain-containing protein [Gammaproteobacteria bacterium]
MIAFRSVQSLFITIILMLVAGIAIPLTYSGYVLMDGIIYQSGTETLKDKLDSLIQPVSQRYERLQRIGLEDSETHLQDIRDSALLQFANYRYKETGSVFVLTNDGRIVISHDFDTGERVTQHSFIAATQGTNEGIVEYAVNSVEKLAVFRHYPAWNETIGLSINKEELFNARNMFLRVILVVLLFSLILATLSLLVLRRRIIKPLIQLANSAKEITR